MEHILRVNSLYKTWNEMKYALYSITPYISKRFSL